MHVVSPALTRYWLFCIRYSHLAFATRYSSFSISNEGSRHIRVAIAPVLPRSLFAIPHSLFLRYFHRGYVMPIRGHYASQADIENLFGVENVARWSQLDNEVTTADTSRIAASLEYA